MQRYELHLENKQGNHIQYFRNKIVHKTKPLTLCKDCYHWMIAINKINVKSEPVYAEPQLINSSIILLPYLMEDMK